jgi:hypothetical protein
MPIPPTRQSHVHRCEQSWLPQNTRANFHEFTQTIRTRSQTRQLGMCWLERRLKLPSIPHTVRRWEITSIRVRVRLRFGPRANNRLQFEDIPQTKVTAFSISQTCARVVGYGRAMVAARNNVTVAEQQDVSPAALGLALRPAADGVNVEIVKRKGPMGVARSTSS